MANNTLERLRSAWNVFLDRSPAEEVGTVYGPSYSIPQFKTRLSYGNERTIVGAIYNRIAVDTSMIPFMHARVDENKQFVETIDSGLNYCLTEETNIDQSSTAFFEDAVLSMFDDGVVALVPVDTSTSMTKSNSFDILTMRTGKVVQWYPHHVQLSVYNDNTGQKQEVKIHKSKVAIIQNPFYSIMNEKSSVVQRLLAKLALLDAIDKQSGSGKLDLIIQLPYVIKSKARQEQAEERRKSIESQLNGSQHGIAYTDGTEKVIQLNRPVENNLMAQIEYLTRMLYGQLGISEKILDGTADEKELMSYQNRVVEPILKAFSSEMKRKFLTRTARTQGQSIVYFRDLFNIVTPERLGDIVDKLSRNKVATANEFRSRIGWKPSSDPSADTLQNANMPVEPSQDPALDPSMVDPSMVDPNAA